MAKKEPNHRISKCNHLNWVIERWVKEHTTKGKTVPAGWETLGYYIRFTDAAARVLDEELAVDFDPKKVLECITAAEERVLEAVRASTRAADARMFFKAGYDSRGGGTMPPDTWSEHTLSKGF